MIRISKKILLLILIFLCLGCFFFSRIKKEPMHEDEYFFVRRAEFFDLFFLKRDFRNKLWNNFDGIDQPYISYYYYGVVLHLLGVKDIKQALDKANFTQLLPGWDVWGRQKNILWKELYQRQHLPPEFQDKFELIIKGRGGGAVALLSCSVLFFIILQRILGFWWALIGIFLFVFSPITNTYGRKTLGDQPLLFFLLLTPLLACWLVKIKSLKKLILGFIIFGINCGLALGTKLNGAATLIFYWFFAFLYSWTRLFKKKTRRIEARTILWNISPIIVGLVAGLLFWALHPIIWNVFKNPFLGFYQFLAFRWEIVRRQAAIWPKESLIGNWPARFFAFGQQLFYLPLKLDLAPFLLGLFLLSKKLLGELKKKKFSEQSIYTLWNLVVFITAYFYISLNWERYYFILVPSVIFFQLYGLSSLRELLTSKKQLTDLFSSKNIY